VPSPDGKATTCRQLTKLNRVLFDYVMKSSWFNVKVDNTHTSDFIKVKSETTTDNRLPYETNQS